MEHIMEDAASKDFKKRLQGASAMQTHIEMSHKLSRDEVNHLVDAYVMLVGDNNFKVTQAAIHAMTALVVKFGDGSVRNHLNVILPPTLERLGDSRQPVREVARELLVSAIEASDTVLEKVTGGWSHKSGKVREEMALAVGEAVAALGLVRVPLKSTLPRVVKLLEDSQSAVRDAAIGCLEEMYRHKGDGLRDLLARHSIRPAQVKEITARFDAIGVVSPAAQSEDDAPHVPAEAAARALSAGGGRPAAVSPPSHPRASSPASPRSGGAPSPHDNGPAAAAGFGFALGAIHSGRDLEDKFAELKSALDERKEWDDRIVAMHKLGALVTEGSALELPEFLPLLRGITDELIVQITDRRSTVVKEACALVSQLAAAVGDKFASMASAFLPHMLRLVIITVHIMAESGHACMLEVLRHCHSPRMVKELCTALRNEKAAKLRACVSQYVLAILRGWSLHEYERNIDHVTAAVASAIGDADADTRATGRECYVEMAATCPAHAQVVLGKVDGSQRQQLMNLAKPGGAGGGSGAGAAPARPVTAHRKPRVAAAAPPPPPRPGTAPHRTGSGGSTGEEAEHARGSDRAGAVGGARRVLAKGADRGGPGPCAQQQQPAAADAGVGGLGGAARIARPASATGPVAAWTAPPATTAGTGARAGAESAGGAPPPAGDIKSALEAASSPNLTWKDKVDVCGMLMAAASSTSPGAVHELARAVPKVVPLLLQYFAEPHFKVALESLLVTREMLAAPAVAAEMQGHLHLLLPLLFLKLIDPKEAVKGEAVHALQEIGGIYPAEVLLPALAATLAGIRSPRGKIGVLEYASHMIKGPAPPAAVRQWAWAVMPYAEDRSLDLRGAAVLAASTVVTCMDPAPVLEHLERMAGPNQRALLGHMERGVPDIEDRLAAFIRAKARGDPFPAQWAGAGGVEAEAEEEEQGDVEEYAPSPPPAAPATPPVLHITPVPSPRVEAVSSPPAPTPPKASPLVIPAEEAAGVCSPSPGPPTPPPAAPVSPAVALPRVMSTEVPVASPGATWSPRSVTPREASPPPPSPAAAAAASPPNADPLPPSPAPAPSVAGLPASPALSAGAMGSPYLRYGPVDAANLGARLDALITQLSHAPAKRRSLLPELNHMLSSAGADPACGGAWAEHAGRLLVLCRDALEDERPSSREQALHAAREIVRRGASWGPAAAAATGEVAMLAPRIFAACADPAREVAHAAEDCLSAVFRHLELPQCLALLRPLLPTEATRADGTAEEGGAQQAVVRTCGVVVRRMQPRQLQACVDEVLPGLFESFRSPSADVRKAVVFCLVDCYGILGDQLMPLLAPLSTSQLKLVTIYIQRMQQKREALRENPPSKQPPPAVL